MTSYLGQDTWRHTQLKVHRVRYSYMIWRHIRDVIMQKYQYSKIVHADFLGTSPSVISGNKIQLYLGTSHSVISGNKIQNSNFCLKLYDFDIHRFWEYHTASFMETKSNYSCLHLKYSKNITKLIFTFIRNSGAQNPTWGNLPIWNVADFDLLISTLPMCNLPIR